MKKQTLINTFFISGMVLSWAGYYSISKWMVNFSGSVFFTGMVLRLAALIVLTVMLLFNREFLGLFKQGRVAFVLLLIGILGFLFDSFANLGFKNSSISTGTVLLKIDVLFANFITALLYKERLRSFDWLGTIIMILGVFFVLDVDFKAMTFNWYDLFFIVSALMVTINAFVIKSAQHKYNISSQTIGYYNNFVVMLLFTISFLIAGDISVIRGINIPPYFYIIILAGGICQSLIYIFYYRNLKYYPVWQVKLRLLLIPIVSSFIGIFMFNESLNLLKILGIILVLAGGIIVIMRDKINGYLSKCKQVTL